MRVLVVSSYPPRHCGIGTYARDQVDAARAGFVASRNDFVAVVSAEKNLRSAELEYQVARATFDRRRAELDRALGRVPGVDENGAAP